MSNDKSRDASPATFPQVLAYLELAEKYRISEFQLREGDFELEFQRGETSPAVNPLPVPATTLAPPIPSPTVSAPLPPRPAPSAPVAGPAAGVRVLSSPITGTFYAAPAPGEAPFAPPGSEVRAGQTLCIVEAMKMMNEIKSEVAGRILAVLADNEALVRQGDPLFHIAPGD